MQHFRGWLVGMAAIAFTACNSGTGTKNNGTETAATASITPATPAGTVDVAITGRDKDTQQITIKFQIKDLKKEKSFEQVILKDAPDAEVFKVLWDQPNSAYIGVLKANHAVRYYHASQEGNDLKILWATAPPEPIWKYMENTMGLGKVSATGNLTKKYSKNMQSGQIIADFVAEIKPDNSPDSVELYVEFGGVQKSMYIGIPTGYQPTIQQTSEADHVYFSLVKDGKAEPFIDLKVDNGRLQVKTLKEIKKD
ncbi:hypothetical protein [Chitinophaga qingshengii]|uniref:Lipoprotein n=1 Tax=Chitinophaga qingshengii TaxID=1569794 RepID=A0ABR7TK70_9BACT|nr:hypothetical protein [Chitinophaga qingshengii]MBC9930363.1 hypothetical protein [Chitinophaga qingshengii]